MGRISQESIEQVIAANDIVAVVSSYVDLDKKSSHNLFGLCPFHTEKTPSFSVTPLKQIYYCFGCHKGGNVISFIQEIEHLNFPEAIHFLAKRAGIEIEEDEDERWQHKREEQKLIYQALLQAAGFFHKTLISDSGQTARTYLSHRGTSIGDWRKFGLGYAPNQWEALYQHLSSQGISDAAMSKAGLITRSSRGNWIDFFRDRVIFPIIDLSGNVLGFGGRALQDQGAKYINTSETAVFHKGSYLFGLPQALKARSDQLIIVEGYMDVIALSKAGFENVVAPLGTALTLQQARLVQRHSKEALLLFDSDNAGESAALRTHEIFSDIGLKAAFILLPEGQDPDDFIRAKGPEHMASLIDNPYDRSSYQLALAERKSRDPESGSLRLLEYQDITLDILAEEENVVLAELYADQLARKLGTSTERIIQEIDRRRGRQQSESVTHDSGSTGGTTAAIRQVKRPKFRPENSNDLKLLRLVAEAPELVKRDLNIQPPDTGRDPMLLEALSALELSAPVRAEDFHSGAIRELAKLALADAETGVLSLSSLLARLQQLEAQLDEIDSSGSDEREKQKMEEFRDDLTQIRESLVQNIASSSQDVTPPLREKTYDQLLRAVRSEQLSWERDKKLAQFNYYNERDEADKAEQAKRDASVYSQAAALVRHSR
ncbi:MAG: DNA primase [Eubacteriales bacterium]|nr:DNA primase [Eubacteriales bacterium]MDD4324640.1 DNA primase [Eubacteriales bacterium]